MAPVECSWLSPSQFDWAARLGSASIVWLFAQGGIPRDFGTAFARPSGVVIRRQTGLAQLRRANPIAWCQRARCQRFQRELNPRSDALAAYNQTLRQHSTVSFEVEDRGHGSVKGCCLGWGKTRDGSPVARGRDSVELPAHDTNAPTCPVSALQTVNGTDHATVHRSFWWLGTRRPPAPRTRDPARRNRPDVSDPAKTHTRRRQLAVRCAAHNARCCLAW